MIAEFLAARGEGTSERLKEASVFVLRSVDGALVHRMLNDGPYEDEEFVIESLCRMVLSYLGVPDHGAFAAPKPVRRK